MKPSYRERAAWIAAEEALQHIARWVAEHPKPKMLDPRWNAAGSQYWNRRIAMRELVYAQSDGKIHMLGVGATEAPEEVPPLFRCRHWEFDRRQDPRDLTHYPELWVSRADVEREWPLDPRIIDLEAQAHSVALLAAPDLGEKTKKPDQGILNQALLDFAQADGRKLKQSDNEARTILIKADATTRQIIAAFRALPPAYRYGRGASPKSSK
jgi:hypothetical protein